MRPGLEKGIPSNQIMKRIVCHAVGLVFAATHAFAGVVPVPKPFFAGEEQTDARMMCEKMNA